MSSSKDSKYGLSLFNKPSDKTVSNSWPPKTNTKTSSTTTVSQTIVSKQYISSSSSSSSTTTSKYQQSKQSDGSKNVSIWNPSSSTSNNFKQTTTAQQSSSYQSAYKSVNGKSETVSSINKNAIDATMMNPASLYKSPYMTNNSTSERITGVIEGTKYLRPGANSGYVSPYRSGTAVVDPSRWGDPKMFPSAYKSVALNAIDKQLAAAVVGPVTKLPPTNLYTGSTKPNLGTAVTHPPSSSAK